MFNGFCFFPLIMASVGKHTSLIKLLLHAQVPHEYRKSNNQVRRKKRCIAMESIEVSRGWVSNVGGGGYMWVNGSVRASTLHEATGLLSDTFYIKSNHFWQTRHLCFSLQQAEWRHQRKPWKKVAIPLRENCFFVYLIFKCFSELTKELRQLYTFIYL